jgi:hypothetical protein
MKTIDNASLKFSKRKLYEPVNELFQVPVCLFEILGLIEEVDSPQTVKAKILLESVIEIALNDPKSWIKIRDMNAEKLVFEKPEITLTN